MKTLITPTIISATILMTGCASVSNWQPVLNDALIKQPKEIADKDVSECNVLANKAAGFTSEGVEGSLAGGISGAGTSAIIGGMITGGAGTLTPIGAALGGFLGLVWSEYDANRVFKTSYSRCLTQRGYQVIN